MGLFEKVFGKKEKQQQYHVSSGKRFETIESRRKIYLEYHELFDRASFNFMRGFPSSTNEMCAEHAVNSASYEIMEKYGISEKEMIDIITEGTLKRWH